MARTLLLGTLLRKAEGTRCTSTYMHRQSKARIGRGTCAHEETLRQSGLPFDWGLKRGGEAASTTPVSFVTNALSPSLTSVTTADTGGPPTLN